VTHYHDFREAAAAWAAQRDTLAQFGLTFEAGAEPRAFLPENFRRNASLAMDALPALSTSANSSIPAMMTTYVDPSWVEVVFAPLAGAEILGESRMGTWIDETALFPILEHTGEVSSYGDFANSGRADANANYPARQSYLFQTFIEIGDREAERAGAGRLNLVAEKNRAAATVLARAMNTIYHYGVAGLQNYGFLNDPNLPAPLTPSTKAAGGVTWFTSAGAPNATANEVFNDFLQLFSQLVAQTGGNVRMDDRLVAVMSPQVYPALSFTNTFGLTARKMVEDNFPNMRFVLDTLYGARTAANPLGNLGGNLFHMIAENINGMPAGTCAYNEKMRTHRVVPGASSFLQKKTSGCWGAVIRIPMAFAQMIGI
jgi:hypothetical protein